jgi:arylsulfatase A-like enzyme
MMFKLDRPVDWLLAACAFCVLAQAVAIAEETSSRRPNVVLFLVDDMGWQDTSVPFHTEVTDFNRRYRTPHMEQLAKAGMKFTQAYACSVCSPTRVSLMTGLNAARHRVTNWTLRKNASNDRGHPQLAFPLWNVNGLSPEPDIERTVHAKALPAYLREAGYRTIHVGKAHFGAIGTPGSDPRNVGFDVNIAGHAAGGPGSFLGKQNFSAVWRRGDRVWDVPGLESYHGKDIFLTEALTIEANKAVDQAVADDKPFFLYMSHYAVHVPFAVDSRFYKKYRDEGLDHTEAMYAAMVEGMDKSLGDILANVKRHGLSDETIVLFMSDNGGLSAHGRGGKPHTHNKPLSSGKGSAHEGGVRVPMIVSWPGVTEAGSVCRQPVIIEDFFSTILEMAGVTSVEQIGGVIDGRSFVKLLRSEQDESREDRPLVWHFPNNWGPKGPGIGPSSAIRLGDWKLIYYHQSQQYELFNLAEDLGEQTNLVEQQRDVRDHLAGELAKYLVSVEAQMPIIKATGEAVPYPGSQERRSGDR